MSSVTVDELVMRIEIELDKFRSQANQAETIDKKLRKSLKDTEGAARDAGDGFNELGADVAESNKALLSKLNTVVAITGKVIKFLGVLAGSNAVQKFATAVANANDQLQFMEKRFGMLGRNIKALDTAVASLGGSGASAMGTIRNLNQGIQEMVLMGNDSLIPFFSALGVGVVDSTGAIREMDDVLLDMADSLSQMNPQQAYALAQAMGLDDGVANALIQGRDAMQEMLDLHEKLYVSTEAELRMSRELAKAQAFMSAQWEGLQTIVANALIPALLKMTKVVSGWMDYLMRNERSVRNFFEGLAIAIGIVLIPILAKAAIGMLALVAPILGTAAVVAVLAGAFALLYDDYKTWAEGGKSLFDWEQFDKYISDTDISVDSLAKGFAKLLTGYESLGEASDAFMEWLQRKGIIDENGFSIRALGDAFKDLGRDIIQAIPALQTMIELIGAVMEGRWSDAVGLAKNIPGQMLGTLIDAGGAAAGHAGGAVDVMLGHDGAGGLAGAAQGVAAWAKGKLGLSGGGGGGPGAMPFGIKSANSGLMPSSDVLMQEFEMAAKKHGVPVSALLALAHQESRFDTAAVGPQTKWGQAKGIMQYLDTTAGSLGFDAFDPVASINAAAMQMRQQMDAGHSIEDAIKHHHAGPNRKIWGAKTDQYGADVMGKMSAIEAQRMARGGMAVPGGGTTAGAAGGVQVTVGTVNVQTSAATLPAATADGVAAGVAQGNEMLNQLGGGIQ